MTTMTPQEDRRSDGAPRRRWAVALVILMAATSLGTQPVISGDTAKDVPPGSIAGRVRPVDLVKTSVSQVLAIVQSPPAAGGESGQRRAEIRRVADGFFDFNEMARLTLSRHWNARTPEEQEEFVRLFTALLERSYLSTIENYAGERITFLGESINGAYAQVGSRITTSRRVEISIDYRLIERAERWAVYDVVLDGVSLVSNYRSQFNSIIRTSSFEDLMTRLRNKRIDAHVIPRVGRAP
jgi:phospholipid transport system substrate-binding protein